MSNTTGLGPQDETKLSTNVNEDLSKRYSPALNKPKPESGEQSPPAAQDSPPKEHHVGIIGAGMAGLYTAMILKSLGIEYEILEASNRIGGRVYTHRFSNDPGDYYDVGAMRFPETPEMKRTFELFHKLGIDKHTEGIQNHGDLIPYYVYSLNTPAYYNNHHQHGPLNEKIGSNPLTFIRTKKLDPTEDAYGWSTDKVGAVPREYIAKGPKGVSDPVIEAWRQKYRENPKATWKELCVLDYSVTTVRQMIIKSLLEKNEHLPTDEMERKECCYRIAQWCETMTGPTGSFDAAFIEYIMHSIDFSYPTDPAAQCGKDSSMLCTTEDRVTTTNKGWWCVNGGADILAQEMTKNVGEVNITKNARVLAIRRHTTPSVRPMRVRIEGNPTERRFSHVIATATTPCLRVMDLSRAGLLSIQNEALRALRYEDAVKFGIKFSKKWWITKGIKGGMGKTDRPTRVCVYPSYALDDPPDENGVLLACYNASTDAVRIGSLARGNDPTNQPLILEVVLQDLAVMHEIPYCTLRNLVVAHHFHDWRSYEFTGGAWGEFGPGQFAHFLTCLQIPASRGNLFFAGELTCINHGWIVSALHSAHRAVALMLKREGENEKFAKMVELWGTVDGHDDRSLKQLLGSTFGGIL